MQSRKNYPCACCVNCGAEQEPDTSSLVWLSDTSVTLAKCRVCHERLDPFVELEFPLIALELMLHRVPAFRHVICNRQLGMSIWIRFALVINFIEVLAHFWITRRDPTPQEVVRHLVASLLVFIASCTSFSLVSSLFLRKEMSKDLVLCELRALILSRFPSVLLVIAMAWWFPSDFYPVIALYTFTASLAAARALPDVDSLLKAGLIAFFGVAPRLARIAFLSR
jgi:hypothetical protein